MNSETTTRKQIIVGALALFALWFVLCRQLSGEWSVNEQYSYGWFVPFFSAVLFWLRWEDRPAAESRKEKGESRKRGIAIGIAILALLILFPVRLIEVANPDWRPLDWIHAAAVVALTLLVLWTAGGWAWVRHFAFPVCFIFVAVPWISPIEEPIVQGLMRTVAALATETITLFGVPAQVEGNLIRVSTGLVGVNEACSGVRSLQTSLMIGLLFGELKRFSLAKRCLLVAGAVFLALLANFGRALFLIWVAATENVSAVDRWHDIAGYAIVGVVFVGSLGLTALLGRRRRQVAVTQRDSARPGFQSRKAKVESDEAAAVSTEVPTSDFRPPSSVLRSPFLLSTFYFLIPLLWSVAIEVGVEAWYRAHEKNLTAVGTWNVRPPEKAAGFREIPIDENVRQTLRFDEGREVSWKEPGLIAQTNSPSTRDPSPNCYLFFFRWYPGTSTILRARAHRPDVCLPSSGWRKIADHGVRTYQANALALPFRHFSFVRDAGSRSLYAHAFFCLGEDKVNPATTRSAFDPSEQMPTDWMPSDRWRVVRDGLRNPGQQVMQFIALSPAQVGPEEAEAQFASVIPGLVEHKVESRK